MSYLGNTPTTQSFISGTDYFNGTGSQTAFTLSRTVASINDIQVTVNNVVQQPNSGYTISGTTLTFDQAPSAGTQNVYVRYLSTTTQAITPSQNTVSWNTLDSNIQQDLGVMYKNRIINGNMAINQRNTTVTPAGGEAYSVDRWAGNSTGSTRFSMQQSTVAPTGFTNSLLITTTTSGTPASGDFCYLVQYIEGFNTADLGFGTANAKTVTLSFWIRSSLTGSFGGSLGNSAGNRRYMFSFTISAANTWEYKTVTVAGDTSGTWLTNNDRGISVVFNLGTGSSNEGTAGIWTTSGIAPTGSVDLVATNGATLYLTGVQLEVGTQATAFSTAGGSYGAELALCQRYFIKLNVNTDQPFSNIGLVDSFNNLQIAYFLPVTMRAVPSVSFTNNQGVANRVNRWTSSDYTETETLTNITGTPQLFTANKGGLTAGVIFRISASWSCSAEL